ncbi:flavin reductase family protein [Prauserella muralis]|uniref:Nitrilotriacetate monooxygenase n=1 Tax=Prauserella muralis TaxID=588067 RepID=A0A2V4AIY9_9PSEU|nr:flavin reductase family protein [Prauserella muralis]PXY18813.1 nitrilotriacetate monooxygenase [Prauserella muralis]TWE28664.1 flavin reductase (DIM6/NTAB) family NADH-FMN oxidoreductase RutF [Prauserella muralis]
MTTLEEHALAPADDPRRYRRSLGCFPTGITVMTAAHGGTRVGVTANSFASVSLEPPLVLWALRADSPSLPVFRHAGHFTVNVLAWHQEDLSRRFATPADDKFAGLNVTEGWGGAPLLDGCAARFETRLAHQFTSGDHVLLVGEVLRYNNFHREPLVFVRGGHRWLDQPGIG